MNNMYFIDLFAGAGGLSEGFRRVGFTPLVHVEKDVHACETLKTRESYYYLKDTNPEVYVDYLKGIISRDAFLGEIPNSRLKTVIRSEISFDNLSDLFTLVDQRIDGNKVDILIGGPPCQAYSIIGRARDPKNMRDDPRNHLYLHYVKFLKKYHPKIFVFENVPGILSANNGIYLEKIFQSISNAGYNYSYKVLNARHFGVLQDRKRVIIIGWQKDFGYEYPTFETSDLEFRVGRDLFGDLPPLEPTQTPLTVKYTKPPNQYQLISRIRDDLGFTTLHHARFNNGRDLEIYKRAIELWLTSRKRLNYAELPPELQTHRNKESFLNRYQVVDPHGVSHTIVAHISSDGHYYIYPDIKQIRSLSVREAARIQSFPDNFFFEGGRTAAFKQIGNAVPPLMAEKIASKLKSMIDQN